MPVTQTITALPEPGHRGVDTQDTFVTKQEAFQDDLHDTFVGELNTVIGQMNALETNVNAKEAAATAAASTATAAATTAQSTSNATLWVSGQTYTAGQSAISIINFQTYRAKTPTSGTTDPSLSADWTALQATDNTKLPLAGGTMTGAVNTTVIDKGTISTGTVTFTVSAGNVQRLQVGGALTIATAGWPTSGIFGDLLVCIVNGGSATVTMPTVNWVQPNGTVTPSFATYLTAIKRTGFQTSGTDFMYLWSTNAGTTIYGKLA